MTCGAASAVFILQQNKVVDRNEERDAAEDRNVPVRVVHHIYACTSDISRHAALLFKCVPGDVDQTFFESWIDDLTFVEVFFPKEENVLMLGVDELKMVH